MPLVLILNAVLFFAACTPYKKVSVHHNEHKFTQKLSQNLHISFLEKDLLKLSFSKEDFKKVEVQIFHKSDHAKVLLLKQTFTEDSQIEFPEASSYKNGFFGALAKGLKKDGSFVSKVTNYNILEQDEINRAKKQMLKR